MDNIYNSLPIDIALKIVSFLPEKEICVLGSCSKFWRKLCGSDLIWVALTRQRWPSLNLPNNSQFSYLAFANHMNWKLFYIKRHYEIAAKASVVVDFVDKSSPSASLEARDYLKALRDVRAMQLDFKDVELFFFKPKLSVLLNLVGLHYCIDSLQAPLKRITESLHCSEIAERQVLVKWWKLGQWVNGFRQRDESHYQMVSMADLATEKHEVLRVLSRGAVYEVMRIEISVASPRSEHWICGSSV